ncbi:MAG: DUF3768 domain-containing protein [Pseudomonadota bacterium]|nr:DUF3768 domain-containing protein [Pseudomonadota bacterium]
MTGSEQLRSPAEDAGRAERIRQLNDQFRSTFAGGKILLTQGITDHAGALLPGLLLQVRLFTSFDEGNDPHGEHDFGAFEWTGETVFWKIDYYDSDLLMGSPDPADPAVTTRVLTIMLAWEY